MKTKNIFFTLFFLGVCSMVIYTGCRKSDRENDTETETVTENTLADYTFSDVLGQVITAASTRNTLFGKLDINATLATCPSVTMTPDTPNTSFPKVLVIDYGTTNCTGSDGITRRGKISASFTGKLKLANTVVTISFGGYYVNDNLL